MSEKAKTGDNKLQALLTPLPRLRSLVVTEIRTLAEKNPVDFNVFYRAFALVSGLLLLVYIPFAIINLNKMKAIALEESKAQLSRSKLSGMSASKAENMSTAYQGMPTTLSDRQKAAIEANDRNAKDPLGPAPIEALEETTGNGAVPRISDDGRKPWYAYSRPYDRGDPRPRIAVVVGELGLARLISDAAIRDLPGSVTLAFSSQSPAADAWMLRARNLGHETVLSIPMEPLDYPSSDPGAETILSKNGNKQNKRLLLKHMQSGKGYIGLATFSGSRMSSSPEKLRPLLQEIEERGLMWLDTRLTSLSSAYGLAKEIDLPAARADFHMNADMGRTMIETTFKDVEAHAQQNGSVTLLVDVSPLTLNILKEWTEGLPAKNLSLAPLTAVTE